MNQNWIVENLNNAFSTWNGKLTELWGLVTTSPQTFKGGAVWGVMQSLHNALIGIFYEVKYSESNDTGVTGGGSITITNKQKPSYELPATGAAGTPPYTAAGALIMGIALMLGYLINKRSHSGGGGKN